MWLVGAAGSETGCADTAIDSAASWTGDKSTGTVSCRVGRAQKRRATCTPPRPAANLPAFFIFSPLFLSACHQPLRRQEILRSGLLYSFRQRKTNFFRTKSNISP